MSKYDEMSDFEINKKIGNEIFGESLEDGYEFEWRVANSLFNDSEAAELFINNGSAFYREASVDYCNNPADMWPIILENDITVSPSLGAWLHDGKPHGYNNDAYEAGKIFESTDENPLRAAAIVFLMMKDAE